MSALAPIVGDVMTPRVPMRRPLISEARAESGLIGSEDLCGTLHAVPGLRVEIVRLIDRDRYALCSWPNARTLVLIQLADLEPFTAPPAVIRDSEF